MIPLHCKTQQHPKDYIIQCYELISGLALGLTLFGHGFFHSTDDIEDMIVAIRVMYVIATATFLIAVIGVYGAVKGKAWLLIIFSTGMSLTVLFVAVDLVSIFVLRKEVLDGVLQVHREDWPTPLDTANTTNLQSLYQMQEIVHCCGVDNGYEDWGSQIHGTCICSGDVSECIPAPPNSTLHDADGEIVMVYKQPCLPILMKLMNIMMSVTIAILAIVELFWTASLVLSILIIVQLRRKVNVPPVYYSAEAKAGNYASLAENAEVE